MTRCICNQSAIWDLHSLCPVHRSTFDKWWWRACAAAIFYFVAAVILKVII